MTQAQILQILQERPFNEGELRKIPFLGETYGIPADRPLPDVEGFELRHIYTIITSDGVTYNLYGRFNAPVDDE
jgi:hypothetical protein